MAPKIYAAYDFLFFEKIAIKWSYPSMLTIRTGVR